jgi:hypothetical protein
VNAWAGLIVFLIGDAWVLFRVLAGARAAQARRLALAAGSLPAPEPAPGRTIWKFTSWHGRGSAGPKRVAPRATFRPTTTATYAPYVPAADDAGVGSGRDLAASLEKLAELHERGQLSDGEFAQAKRELLGTEDSAPPE